MPRPNDAPTRMHSSAAAEAAFFRSLNSVVEPIAKQGWLSPGFLPVGLVTLEITGRKSGRVTSVPLLATRVGELLLVSTLRGGRSQWLRNLAARPHVRYWVDGGANEGSAIVLEPGAAQGMLPPEPPYLALLVSQLRPWTLVGWSFALIVPNSRGD